MKTYGLTTAKRINGLGIDLAFLGFLFTANPIWLVCLPVGLLMTCTIAAGGGAIQGILEGFEYKDQ